MTEPLARVPIPVVPVDWTSLPTFCSRRQIHQATNHKPLCPVCLDDDVKREAS